MKKLFIALLIVISLFFTGMVLMLTPPVRKLVLDYLKNEVKRQTGYKVSASDIAFSFPLKLNATEIEIRDENKAWLQIKKMMIEIDPMELYIGRIVINNLAFEGVDLAQPTPAFGSNLTSLGGSKIPFFSPIISFENIDIKQLRLIKDTEALPSLNLNGTAISNIQTGKVESFINFNCTPLGSSEFYGKLRCFYENNMLQGDIQLNYTKFPFISPSGEMHGYFKCNESLSANLELWNKIDNSNVLKGNVHSFCKIEGPLAAPLIKLYSEATSFTLNGVSLPDSKAKIICNCTEKGVKGDLSISTPWNEQPIKVNTVFSSDSQQISLMVDIPKANYEDFFIEDASLSMQLYNIFNQAFGDLKTSIKKLSNSTTELHEFVAETQIKNLSQRSPFFMQGVTVEPAQGKFHTSGSWYYSQDKVSLEIDQCKGRFANIPFNLNEQLLLQFQKNAWEISQFNLGLGKGTIEGHLTCNASSDKGLSCHLGAKGEIANILELFFPDLLSLKGTCEVSLDLVGTLQSPQLFGKVEIKNGSLESLELGAGLEQVHAIAIADGKQINLEQFSGKDHAEGTFHGNGYLMLTAENGYPFEIVCSLNKLRLLNLDSAMSDVNGNLRIKGNKEGMLAEGQLAATSANITLPDQIPELINTIEVTYINQSPLEKPPSKAAKPFTPPLPIKLDIQLDVQNRAMIKGKDFKCNWNGSVKITGSPSAPELFGNFKLFKGEYLFRGKDFQINDGTITFAGDPEKKTTLYITATKELNDIKIDVILRGPLNNPSIVFRSNPPMSQREILSWLLFNVGLSDITPFQGTALNESISNLPTDAEPDVLQKFQKSIGIDRIDISRDEGGDSNVVQFGKYISRGFYVHIDKSISAETNRIAVEAKLMKNIKLQAEFSDNSNAQLLLKWKKDY